MIYKTIISGGGTGGHIFPAIAIAMEIKNRNLKNEILFVGAADRMEMKKVPEAGFNIVGIKISGFQRNFFFKNLSIPFKILKSLFQCRKILKNFKPDISVGVGGYASGPLLFFSAVNKIPTLIQEQNSFPGITNKILGKMVDKICVAYSGMEKFFPNEKIVITGNPVKKELTQLNKLSDFKKNLIFNEHKPTLLVIGGSLGARTINNALLNGINKILENDIQLIWQTGDNGYNEILKSISEKFSEKENINLLLKSRVENNVKIFPFINKMSEAYQSADLVIARAGAISISELCVTGKPCILIPSPNVAEDHQTKNAMTLIENNAAILVKDIEANSKLIDTALRVIKDKKQLTELSENIKKLAKPDASERIVDEIEQLIRKKNLWN